MTVDMNTLSREKLSKCVSSFDFAVLEACLFLDTHPKNQKALAYFNEMNEKRSTAAALYASKYGPLTVSDNNNPNEWDWVKTAWPWEGVN
ncbi:MAG: spore coat protein CotJB [Clostridia bacterium]